MKKDYKVAGAPATFLPEVKPGDTQWKQNQKFLTDHVDSIDELRQAASREHLGFVSSASQADFTEEDRVLFDMPLSPQELEAEKKRSLEDRWLISMYVPNLHYMRDAGQMLAADAPAQRPRTTMKPRMRTSCRSLASAGTHRNYRC